MRTITFARINIHLAARSIMLVCVRLYRGRSMRAFIYLIVKYIIWHIIIRRFFIYWLFVHLSLIYFKLWFITDVWVMCLYVLDERARECVWNALQLSPHLFALMLHQLCGSAYSIAWNYIYNFSDYMFQQTYFKIFI